MAKPIFNRLLNEIKAIQILPKKQFRFWLSITQSALRVTKIIKDVIAASTSLNVYKAFDHVWHSVLFCKFISSDSGKNIKHFFLFYLQNQPYSDKNHEHFSTEWQICAGVPNNSPYILQYLHCWCYPNPTNRFRFISWQ